MSLFDETANSQSCRAYRRANPVKATPPEDVADGCPFLERVDDCEWEGLCCDCPRRYTL